MVKKMIANVRIFEDGSVDISTVPNVLGGGWFNVGSMSDEFDDSLFEDADNDDNAEEEEDNL